jgi:hypothetical protein
VDRPSDPQWSVTDVDTCRVHDLAPHNACAVHGTAGSVRKYVPSSLANVCRRMIDRHHCPCAAEDLILSRVQAGLLEPKRSALDESNSK